MLKNLCSLALVVFIVGTIKGQYYENGQDPFSIHWKQIQTPHFQVIFSDEIESTGKLYAAYLEKIYQTGGITLNHKPSKIPVILHNKTTYSNGEVAWTPKRMNLYATPPQSGYSEVYGKHLALHEFRHVVQIDKLNQSSTKVLGYFLGQQAIGAVLGWHIPLWFFEGDAVAYETGASNTGRGAIADFTMHLKAQVEHYGIYSYPKAQFGSYKNYVPNHYELGYQLITRSNIKYGSEIWTSTLNQIAKSPVHPNAFSKGIKKYTGIPERKLYAEMMQGFKKEWSPGILATKGALRTQDYKNYLSPHFHDNGIIAYKTSYKHIPRLVHIDSSGKERVIKYSGSILNSTFSKNGNILIWNEFKRTRWQNKNYNRIVSYNIENGKQHYLTKKTKAFQSRISPDQAKILSVEIDDQLYWKITIRSVNNGELIKEIPWGKSQPVQPSWSPEMDEIVLLQVNDNGKSLGLLNLNTKHVEWLVKESYLDLQNPICQGDKVYVNAIQNGVTSLLMYHTTEKQWFTLTNEKYGINEYRIKDGQLLYSNYGPDGYRIKQKTNPTETASHGPELYNTPQRKHLIKQESYVDLNAIDTNFTLSNYSRLKHLVNIHSWAPLGINIQNIEVGPGATIMSQNALSTSTMVGGYLYNITDQSHKYYADFTYKGFYPHLSFGFSSLYMNDTLSDDKGITHQVKWNETSAYSVVSVPFNLDRGKWFRRIQPTMQYSYTAINPDNENDVQLNDAQIHRLYYTLYLSNTMDQSHRDLQPKWGQVIRLKYMHSPIDIGQYGQLASGELFAYFPGIIANHGIRLYGGIQKKEYGDYGFNDQLIYPYGHLKLYNTSMKTAHAYYKLPLLYPDLNVWEYFYIKRLKAELFYQQAFFQYGNYEKNISSLGADLTADMHIFRFTLPFELGIRYARKLPVNENFYSFLFNIEF